MASRADDPAPSTRKPGARGRVLGARARVRAELALQLGRAPGRGVGRLGPSGGDAPGVGPAAPEDMAVESRRGPPSSMTRERAQLDAREPEPGEPSTAERAALALGQLADALGTVTSSVRTLAHAVDALATIVSSAEDPT